MFTSNCTSNKVFQIVQIHWLSSLIQLSIPTQLTHSSFRFVLLLPTIPFDSGAERKRPSSKAKGWCGVKDFIVHILPSCQKFRNVIWFKPIGKILESPNSWKFLWLSARFAVLTTQRLLELSQICVCRRFACEILPQAVSFPLTACLVFRTIYSYSPLRSPFKSYSIRSSISFIQETIEKRTKVLSRRTGLQESGCVVKCRVASVFRYKEVICIKFQ